MTSPRHKVSEYMGDGPLTLSPQELLSGPDSLARDPRDACSQEPASPGQESSEKQGHPSTVPHLFLLIRLFLRDHEMIDSCLWQRPKEGKSGRKEPEMRDVHKGPTESPSLQQLLPKGQETASCPWGAPQPLPEQGMEARQAQRPAPEL